MLFIICYEIDTVSGILMQRLVYDSLLLVLIIKSFWWTLSTSFIIFDGKCTVYSCTNYDGTMKKVFSFKFHEEKVFDPEFK